MAERDAPRTVARREAAMLGIYLNDHVAGATGGLELFRRAAGAHRGSETGAILERLTGEIVEDRAALLDMLRTLGVPVRRYKVYAGWVGEKLGRLKLNGRLLGRSPLSSLLELEALRLGVEGKGAGWKTLRTVAERDDRLDAERLDGLIARAERQVEELEDLRVRTAADLFGVASAGTGQDVPGTR
ncbi:MAG TPA: hypothetical protein VGR21_08050 [Cryptosporangiaceae bacterium]|nr:hypothetical protein [Cryptosporangiaceae bacterium]